MDNVLIKLMSERKTPLRAMGYWLIVMGIVIATAVYLIAFCLVIAVQAMIRDLLRHPESGRAYTHRRMAEKTEWFNLENERLREAWQMTRLKRYLSKRGKNN